MPPYLWRHTQWRDQNVHFWSTNQCIVWREGSRYFSCPVYCAIQKLQNPKQFMLYFIMHAYHILGQKGPAACRHIPAYLAIDRKKPLVYDREEYCNSNERWYWSLWLGMKPRMCKIFGFQLIAPPPQNKQHIPA